MTEIESPLSRDPAAAPSWRWRRSVVGWLGLLVMAAMLLANAALPASAGGERLNAALSGDRLVLCTPSGLIQIDLDGNPLGPVDDHLHGGLCVFCLPLMQAALTAPLIVAVLVVSDPPAEDLLAPTIAALPTPRPAELGAVSPRGPPAA